jgi:ubiquinone/menaquinone biosynthesis C-methylase UbiE
VLSIYDPWLINFENPFVWSCPSKNILDFYNRHVSSEHLDVGVGTGYYLDKAHFPSPTPVISLLDLNPNSLYTTAHRIRRYQPMTYRTNVLEPISFDLPQFDSIGVNYLLHCLPGNLKTKGVVFRHLTPFLRSEGVLFGSTILGEGMRFNLLGKLFMRVYNSNLIPNSRVLSNQQDRLEDLLDSLQENFGNYTTEVIGNVVFFVARLPKLGNSGVPDGKT